MKHAMARGSFDGGDQGLLNTFFSDWPTKDIATHLPFIYNMVATATYSYLPAYKYFGKNVKIVHFIGATKPWLVTFDEAGNARIGSSEKHTHLHLKLWWQIFNNSVRPLLNKTAPSNSVSTSRLLTSQQQLCYEMRSLGSGLSGHGDECRLHGVAPRPRPDRDPGPGRQQGVLGVRLPRLHGHSKLRQHSQENRKNYSR